MDKEMGGRRDIYRDPVAPSFSFSGSLWIMTVMVRIIATRHLKMKHEPIIS